MDTGVHLFHGLRLRGRTACDVVCPFRPGAAGHHDPDDRPSSVYPCRSTGVLLCAYGKSATSYMLGLSVAPSLCTSEVLDAPRHDAVAPIQKTRSSACSRRHRRRSRIGSQRPGHCMVTSPCAAWLEAQLGTLRRATTQHLEGTGPSKGSLSLMLRACREGVTKFRR